MKTTFFPGQPASTKLLRWIFGLGATSNIVNGGAFLEASEANALWTFAGGSLLTTGCVLIVLVLLHSTRSPIAPRVDLTDHGITVREEILKRRIRLAQVVIARSEMNHLLSQKTSNSDVAIPHSDAHQ